HSASDFIMKNNIRNCWSPISSASLRKTRFIQFFEKVGRESPRRPRRKLEGGALRRRAYRVRPSNSSTSTRRLLRLAPTDADSLMTTKSPDTERWFPRFRLLRGRSQTASIWHSSRTMVTRVRNSGYHSDG